MPSETSQLFDAILAKAKELAAPVLPDGQHVYLFDITEPQVLVETQHLLQAILSVENDDVLSPTRRALEFLGVTNESVAKLLKAEPWIRDASEVAQGNSDQVDFAINAARTLSDVLRQPLDDSHLLVSIARDGCGASQIFEQLDVSRDQVIEAAASLKTASSSRPAQPNRPQPVDSVEIDLDAVQRDIARVTRSLEGIATLVLTPTTARLTGSVVQDAISDLMDVEERVARLVPPLARTAPASTTDPTLRPPLAPRPPLPPREGR